MANYEVKIVASSKELSAKERVQLKDTTDCIKLDKATLEAKEAGSALIINPAFFAELAIHNEKSDDKDYTAYVVVDDCGIRYTTGSTSFWNAFINIVDEMAEETEPWAIKVFRMPSKNRQGKDFLTCSLI